MCASRQHSARTVIIPGPELDHDEIGMPEYIAMRLTLPVKVTKFNIRLLTQAVLNGPSIYPGACTLVQDGVVRDLKYAHPSGTNLRQGDTVERHIIDGDVCIINRQPTLFRGSMMAHKVKVFKDKAIKLHPANCKMYGADFDGDEINLHIPQTLEAQVEATILMSPRNMMRTGMGLVQDTLTGAFLCSWRNSLLSKSMLGNMLAKADTSSSKRIAFLPRTSTSRTRRRTSSATTP